MSDYPISIRSHLLESGQSCKIGPSKSYFSVYMLPLPVNIPAVSPITFPYSSVFCSAICLLKLFFFYLCFPIHSPLLPSSLFLSTTSLSFPPLLFLFALFSCLCFCLYFIVNFIHFAITTSNRVINLTSYLIHFPSKLTFL